MERNISLRNRWSRHAPTLHTGWGCSVTQQGKQTHNSLILLIWDPLIDTTKNLSLSYLNCSRKIMANSTTHTSSFESVPFPHFHEGAVSKAEHHGYRNSNVKTRFRPALTSKLKVNRLNTKNVNCIDHFITYSTTMQLISSKLNKNTGKVHNYYTINLCFCFGLSRKYHVYGTTK